MPRREYPLDVACTEPGCHHKARYRYGSRRELMESWELKHASTYKCVRHSKGKGALGPSNLKAEWLSQPSAASVQGSPKRFFGNDGVLIGPGYYVSADDFPEGAKVKITCEVILP